MAKARYDKKWLGPRLRELSAAAGLSAKALGEKAQKTRGEALSQSAVEKIMAGTRQPTWGTILALAIALGVTVEELASPPEGGPVRKPGRPSAAP